MKIGIITQPLHANYGGIFQNYALQQVLKRMGHEVWTVDYNKFGWIDWADCVWRVLAHKILGHSVKYPKTPSQRRMQEKPLRRFVYKYISLTEPRTKYFERKTINKYAFDALVVGSDQVWRPRYNYDVADCFLKFAGSMPVKRVAYAASFGTDAWELTKELTAECAALAKSFNGISVREKSGVALCKEHLDVEATHVLDPTLLLHATDYEELCKDIPKRKPVVFAYILDESEDKQRQIREFAARHNLDYFIKSADATVCMDDTVELWLSYFRDAAFVITDSFHGTAFAINFNKDFYVFGNADRGNSRFDSLLGVLGLESRMTKDLEHSEKQDIDWGRVNSVRELLANESLNWIRSNLRQTGSIR